MGFLVWLALSGIIIGTVLKLDAAQKAKDTTIAAIEDVKDVQEDRLQHAYDAQLTRITETAQTVRGKQNEALVGMGQLGGAGTAAAAVIEGTSQEEKKDIDLLDQNLSDALADLNAETALATTRTNNQYNLQVTSIVTDAITGFTQIGLNYGDMKLGTRTASNYSTLLGGGGDVFDSTEYNLLAPMG